MRFFRILAALLSLTVMTGIANSADMQIAEYKGKMSIIIEGEFVSGDSFDFERLYTFSEDHIEQIVLFSSPGGAIEGYDIARTVFEEGLHVVVAEDAVCVSYCAIIYEAADTKTMEPGSVLKYHSVYIPPHLVVEMWEEGYCTDEVDDDGLEYEKCGQEFAKAGVVEGVQDMTRDTLRDMLIFFEEIGMDIQMMLKIMEYGASDFYQVSAPVKGK